MSGSTWVPPMAGRPPADPLARGDSALSPDGSWIAFAGTRSFSGGIFVIRADGTAEQPVDDGRRLARRWPDGRQIGYLAIGPGGDQQIRVTTIDAGEPRTISGINLLGTNHPFAITHDGRTIVVTNAVHLSDEIWLLEPKK